MKAPNIVGRHRTRTLSLQRLRGQDQPASRSVAPPGFHTEIRPSSHRCRARSVRQFPVEKTLLAVERAIDDVAGVGQRRVR